MSYIFLFNPPPLPFPYCYRGSFAEAEWMWLISCIFVAYKVENNTQILLWLLKVEETSFGDTS